MSDGRQNDAVAFLTGVLGPQIKDVQSGALEELPRVDLAEAMRPAGAVPEEKRPLVERTLGKISERRPLEAAEAFALEAIIIPDKRPAIDVLVGNQFATEHPLWVHLNAGPRHDAIVQALSSVGRVELPGHPSLPYGGTGFVVGDGLVMTNRHVAEIFCGGLGLRKLKFLPGRTAKLDLEQRVDGGSTLLSVRHVAMIHPYWDMAVLIVDGLPEAVKPLRLATSEPLDREIVALGYPAFDPRNDAQVQHEVFRGVYSVKRVMPGRLNGRSDVSSFGKSVRASTHDSSTLGGASGSAVVDPETGLVVALHFGGQYLKANYGVPAMELSRDPRVVDTGVLFDEAPRAADGPWDAFWRKAETSVAETTIQAKPISASAPVAGQSLSLTLPLTITLTLGQPEPPPRQVSSAAGSSIPNDIAPIEAPLEDYETRTGYRPDFLDVNIALPRVVDRSDVLAFTVKGQEETELRYEHFSVVMSRSRRMCFFSAVNLDGGLSRKSPRTGWRLDPRIPSAQQIVNECYGNPPKFSRGHMTRREDPVWGDSETAARGNADSMHVTNATPQMQAFNSPIWLGLEDYALEHARQDAMKINVFTGPYFSDQDPTFHGVRIPTGFWKVIAFIHDETGQLCATGYEMSQETVLPAGNAEFVFGDYRSKHLGVTTQTALVGIERRSGISFGALTRADPKSSGQNEAVLSEPVELGAFEQIAFF